MNGVAQCTLVHNSGGASCPILSLKMQLATNVDSNMYHYDHKELVLSN